MKVKVLSCNNTNSKGIKTIGKIGELISLDEKLIISLEDGLLRTSRITGFTVKTRNSIYELEVINEQKENA